MPHIRSAAPVLLLALLLPAQEQAPLTEDERILHVLSRLTPGPRPGDLAAVRAMGIQKWLDAQLAPESIPDPRVEAAWKTLPTLGLSPQELKDLSEGKRAGKARDLEDVYRDSTLELRRAIVLGSLNTERGLADVMAHFWRNHFNVDQSKDSVRYTATHYEQHVLRPNVLGRFPDLLAATARHPAMLVYLDNALSRRPPSKSELRQLERRVRKQTGSNETAREQVEIAKQSGLNENYARELMELHTLGVDNGYTQKDVIEVARAFTGWTVDFGKDPVGFVFRSDMHDPGSKFVLGRAVAEGRQEDAIQEGESILKRLSVHEGTSDFLATKLVILLLDDAPPPKVVEAAARAFRGSKGDIRQTVRAIVAHPQFFDRAHFRVKFKTPFEYVVSALRAVNAEISNADSVVEAIEMLGMPIYGCEDPTGYDDSADAWRDPGVMAYRWKFAMQLVSGHLPGVFLPGDWYDTLPSDPLEIVATLKGRICPGGIGAATQTVLERVVLEEAQSGSLMEGRGRIRLARRITGILIGCPEFQQQ